MHSSVLAIWKNQLPGLPCDIQLCCPTRGILLPLHDSKINGKNRKRWRFEPLLFNGMEAWADIAGRTIRMRMLFDAASESFVFPEMFKQNAEQRDKAARAARILQKGAIDAAYRAARPSSKPVSDIRLVSDSDERATAPEGEVIAPFPVVLA